MPARIPLPDDRRTPLGTPDAGAWCPRFGELQRAAYAAVTAVDALDPVTGELVRLANARAQDCHLCLGLRDARALREGATEELLERAGDPASPALSDRQRRALELAACYLGSPPAVPSPEAAERIAEVLTATQAVEVVLKLAVASSNKIQRALGLDLDEVRRQVYDPTAGAGGTD